MLLPVRLSDVDYTGGCVFPDRVGSPPVPQPLRTQLDSGSELGSPSVGPYWRAISGISYDSWHILLGLLS